MAGYTPNSKLSFNTELVTPDATLNFTKTGDSDLDVSISGAIVYDLNPVIKATASYDPNVFRGAICEKSGGYESSRLIGMTKQGSYESNKLIAASYKLLFEPSILISKQLTGTYESNKLIGVRSAVLTEQSRLIGRSLYLIAESGLMLGKSLQSLTEQSRLVGKHRSILAESMIFIATQQQYKAESCVLIGKRLTAEYKSALFTAYALKVMAEAAKIPSWLAPKAIEIDEYEPSSALDFSCKWFAPSTLLNFGVGCQHQIDPSEPEEPIDPSTSGVIFVTNSVLLTRTDSGNSVRLLSFNVGIDNNSYCWTFSASVPFTELSKVDITNEPLIEVDLTVNGQLWRFILDACDDSAQFNSNSLTIRGKSRAILLSQPFAQPRSHKYTSARTARQIANDELNRNAVPSGFTLDWQLIGENGWSVPADTYSYTNKTAINSLQAIAEAAGGFINTHPSDDVIKFLSNYPLPSWEWFAQSPSITIDHSLITSRSRNRVQKPKYDGVLVSGQYDGSIAALIRRSGTAGAYQPTMITNELITDSAVARHRGQCVLSDTGDIGSIGLSMPLHSDVGLLTPSTLVRVNDGESWVGMVRGTSISGRLATNDSLQIEQSIDVERHFDKG